MDGPRTLTIDVGGTGIKMLVLDAAGVPISDRDRVKTPRRAGPARTMEVIAKMIRKQPSFDRVSVGFPGVVVRGVASTAPNLGTSLWVGVDVQRAIEEAVGRPTRVINDADLAGLGVIRGEGTEMLITLGTGVGSALFTGGRLLPNLELGHHLYRRGRTYEQRVSNRERKRIGADRWSRRVRDVVYALGPIFNYDVLYLGGGNSRHLTVTLPANVTIVDNRAALHGGIALWREAAP